MPWPWIALLRDTAAMSKFSTEKLSKMNYCKSIGILLVKIFFSILNQNFCFFNKQCPIAIDAKA
jgi:hypothetical protein